MRRYNCGCGGGGRARRMGCLIEYVAALVIGILLAMLLPVWLCFSIIVGLLVLICVFF